MLALLLAAAAVDCRRCRARLRRRCPERIGQWTAFRKYADDDAVMFTPQAVWAHEFLAGRKDPPKSRSSGGPSASWVSCDGRTAVNTRSLGDRGGQVDRLFHDRVAARAGKGWKWIYDGGDELVAPRRCRRRRQVERASCVGRAKIPAAQYRADVKPIARSAGKPPADAGQGRSADGTLIWRMEGRGVRRAPFPGQAVERRATIAQVVDQTIPAPTAAMIELFSSALVTFLVIIDPPGCAPIFASLTRGIDARAPAGDGDPRRR